MVNNDVPMTHICLAHMAHLMRSMMKERIKRILGVIMIIFAVIGYAGLVSQDIRLIGLTPEKCTGEVTGYVTGSVHGSHLRYSGNGWNRYGRTSSVYYDVIAYEVEGKTYEITSHHAQASETLAGAQTQVYYNPEDPAKAYDNTPPYLEGLPYFYPGVFALLGIVLIFRLDKYLKHK